MKRLILQNASKTIQPSRLPRRRKVLGWTLSFALLGGSWASAASTNPGSQPSPVGKTDPKTKTGIEWQVKPEKVEIFLDDKKLGTAKELSFSSARPGKHTIRLVNGGDETEFEVTVHKNQVLKLTYAFEEE